MKKRIIWKAIYLEKLYREILELIRDKIYSVKLVKKIPKKRKSSKKSKSLAGRLNKGKGIILIKKINDFDDILDTFIHELIHAVRPYYSERRVEKVAPKIMDSLTQIQRGNLWLKMGLMLDLKRLRDEKEFEQFIRAGVLLFKGQSGLERFDEAIKKKSQTVTV